MYLYLVNEPGDVWSTAGLAPSKRGRAAKNHHDHTFMTASGTEFSGHFGAVTQEVFDRAGSAADLKQEIIDGKGLDRPAIAPRELVLLWADAVKCTLTDLRACEESAEMPASMKLQIDTVVEAIGKLLKPGASTDEEMQELEEIIANNKKLINVALGTMNATWTRRNGLLIDNVERVAKRKARKTETETADEPKISTFGFERLSGAKPELKVVDPAILPSSDSSGVFEPQPDPTYIINESTENLFRILSVSRRQSPQNVNLVGPHGCGKTELAIQFAARASAPMLIMDCANLREARDWFGYKTAKEGTVYWQESQFVRAVEAGGHVILLDELNRANPHILNTLMPLLDGRRFTFLEEKGDKICVGPGTVFFATMNEGAGYTGTTTIDRALRDRFPRRLELTYLGEKDEIKLLVNRIGIEKEIASLLVQMANKIRQDSTGLSASLTESVSTRQLLAAAYDFMIGGVETLQFTISNHFSPDGDDESERVKVQNIIQGKFGHLLAATAGKKKGA
jgi:hypothetical protein